MYDLRCSPMTLGLMLMAVCFAASFAFAANPIPSRPGVPESCAVQLKTHNFTTDVLDQVHEMGFTAVRRGFYWNAVEKEKGVYTFEMYDEQMAHAKELDLTVIICLFAGNKMYEEDGQGGIQTEAGRQGFANFAAAVAERYKDQKIILEVWNEPNVRTFWRKNGKHNSTEFAKEYTDLVKAIAPAVLKVYPDAIIAVGSVSNYWPPSYSWTEDCFKMGILDTGVKVWSVHPYGVKRPEDFAEGHTITRNLLKKYGHPDMTMLNTERGFAVKPSAEGWSGGEEAEARKYQSWHFVRQYMADFMHDLPMTSWYEWDGDKFGIADEGGSRPIYAAATTMFTQLDGYDYVRRLDTGYELDYALLFENQSDQKKLVVWTAPPPGESPDKAYEHKVQIDAANARAVDLAGNAVNVSGNALTISGSPQYVSFTGNVSVTSLQPYKAPIPEAGDVPQSATELNLFDGGTDWEFVENTGQGSFKTATADDGKAIGVLEYDFTNSQAQGTPYVLAGAAINVDGGEDLILSVRTPIRQKLTFRLIDATGQVHQYKTQSQGSDKWERIRIPLDRKLESWGGANDGKKHLPLKRIFFSVPLPDPLHKTGKIEFADVAVTSGGGGQPAASTKAPASLDEPKNLNAFGNVSSWQFLQNTGDGSFDISREGDMAYGIVYYDFTNSQAQGTPYVLAQGDITIAGGAEVTMKIRSDVAQPLTFRFKDATGQTLQHKTRIKGTGNWETISIPLTKKFEHWGGANDGAPHFPIETIFLSVPRPSEDQKTGKVEYADITVK